MRLIEPLGLCHGAAARAAVRAGAALPLAGGPAEPSTAFSSAFSTAFSLARLIDGSAGEPLPIAAVPADWQSELRRLTATVPSWAGLPAHRPSVMGILNVTPDSFSDGGLYPDADAAIAAGLAMAEAGADIVDVGGESTRPGAQAVSPEIEQSRALPVIAALTERGVRVSVDTRHAATMAAALDAGATIVNDVSGLFRDPAAPRLIAARRAWVVVLHMRGDPDTMARKAVYDDVATTVVRELADRVAAAEQAGIAPDRIAVDPGIGFAKTAIHNLEILARLPLLLNLGRRVLVGVSRKAFIGALAGGVPPHARDPGSLAVGLHALACGASIVRVHDVDATVQAIRAWHPMVA